MIFNAETNASIAVYLESIEIITPPSKTTYQVGELFDPSGMEVQTTYSNGDKAITGRYTWSPDGPLDGTDTVITISYTESGKTATATVPIEVITTHIYGVMWNYGNSSTKLTRLTPDTDPQNVVNTTIDKEPVAAVGDGDGSSPFDDLMPWAGMEEYNILSDGTIIKSGEEGFSRTQNDTMVYIPEFWYMVADDASNKKRYFYISDAEADGFEMHPGSGQYVSRYNVQYNTWKSVSGVVPNSSTTISAMRTLCKNKGDGWYTYDFTTYCALCILYIVEYADWDSQTKIGIGYRTNNQVRSKAGSTDVMQYHTGYVVSGEYDHPVQYRNIEDIWGNVFDIVDGIMFDGRSAYVCTDKSKYANAISVDYTNTGIVLPSFSVGSGTPYYITGLGFSKEFSWAFIPNSASLGSSTSYIPDRVFSDSITCGLSVGGGLLNENGLFCFYGSVPVSISQSVTGGRSIYIPPEES